MIVQLALDTLGGIRTLLEVGDLVDIVEVGTPLIKRFGMSIVREVAEMTTHPVLADTKTMDAGEDEARLAFTNGARFMTVLAAAGDKTLEAACQAAESMDAYVVLDTIGCADATERLAMRYPDRVGYVTLHLGTDARRGISAGTASMFSGLAALDPLPNLVGLIGGISPASIEAVVAARPQLVVVGSGVTGAVDPRATMLQIHRHLIRHGRDWPWEPR